MNDIEIEYSESTKYLGVHLDSKLLWSTHFDRVASKAIFNALNGSSR